MKTRGGPVSESVGMTSTAVGIFTGLQGNPSRSRIIAITSNFASTVRGIVLEPIW